MRTTLAVLLAAGVAFATIPAAHAAPIYPWCTTGAGHDFGARNCGFVSFEQCMQTARGNGQFCERNPFYEPAPAVAARKKAHTK